MVGTKEIGRDQRGAPLPGRAGPSIHKPLPIAVGRLPERLPAIDLGHGQAIWLLTRMGYRGRVSDATFREYIKSLRKLGSPFAPVKTPHAQRGQSKSYSYFHLMELAVTLALRVYQVVPDSVLKEIIRHRGRLYAHYARAYRERISGLGAPIVLSANSQDSIQLRGLFLDLQISFAGGKLGSCRPPRLLSPLQAAASFVERDVADRSLPPLNLSMLAERVVALALSAPEIRTGPSFRRRRAGA